MTATNGLAGRREWAGLAVLLLPTLVLAMDMGVLFFAVPFIATDLHPSGTQQLWIMDMYSFLLAGLLIPMGALGDRIGRRKLLVVGSAGFAAASLVAAYADGAGRLIAVRGLLGVFAAVFGPSTLALVRTTFRDPGQRRAAIGAWSAVMMAGATLGPVVGGLLLDHFWWGSVFLVAVPAMLVVVVAAPLLLPEQRTERRGGRFDLPGAALSMATVLPVVYGIKTLAVDGWHPLPALVLAAGLLIGALLVVRLRTAADPLIDLGLFRIRTFSGAITVNTIAMFAMMGFTLFTSQYLQLVKGLSPLAASLWALLPSLGVGAAVGTFGALAGRVRPATLLTTGFLLSAAGFVLMTAVGKDSPMAVVLVAAGVIAAGSVGTITITADMVVSAAPAERAGAAGATSETAQELGSSLGIAILGAAGAAVYRGRLDGALPGGLTGDAAGAAKDTLGGAVTVAAHLPGDAGRQLLSAARIAFTDGMHVAAVVGVVFMAGAALAAHRLMRHLPVAVPATAPAAEDDRTAVPAAA
ncbi:MFS transporter [Kitasatospora paracochleata]|uniref:DHA2 family multidrug resistance protein-like MFS transporter n=1 Tax=Kitasatospora paracochleata TaxID=58354 RepID=A0ABT1J5R3_9ACTN|nr:MFS transporter [Kitasatospora paracochleata]MCP2312774.1 DHA2 family multidrug resistance protein-like MFS transporter [Kitasatospora paracochleata]